MGDDLNRPATKGDLTALRLEMRSMSAELRGEIRSMESRLMEALRGFESRLMKAFDEAREASERRLRELPPRP